MCPLSSLPPVSALLIKLFIEKQLGWKCAFILAAMSGWRV